MDKDVKHFADEIGAIEPGQNHPEYVFWQRMFKRRNYFFLDCHFLIIKISRSPKPFWGVGKKFIDKLNERENYYLVLLTSPREGWVFSKSDVNANIQNKKWRLSKTDNNYKINPPLADLYAFPSSSAFFEKTCILNLQSN